MDAELKKLAERTYCLMARTHIGFFLLSENEVCVIDSGIDDAAGEDILEVLREQGWQARCLINTHGHADHVGGNRVIQKATGCTVFACGAEADIARETFLNSSMLYGGKPPHDLHGRFFYAAPADVKDICFTREGFPAELKVLPLSGHSPDMIGILTPDGVAFIGDSLCDEATLEKNPFAFQYDPEAAVQTFDFLEMLSAKLYVPSHLEILTDLTALIHTNRAAMIKVEELILAVLQTPRCFDDLLKALLDDIKLPLNFPRYALIGSTVRSYLSVLRHNGKIVPLFEENRLLWKAV